MRIIFLCTASLFIVATVSAAEPRAAQADLDFFEKKIRPVLATHCYSCHSAKAKKLQGGLLVDSRKGLEQGGDTGPAVVARKPDESLLLEALRYESFEMPPKGKLPDAVIADFEKWIKRGAVDPRDGGKVVKKGIDLEAGRKFWAFQPLRERKIRDIDDFIDDQLAVKDLRRSPVADKRTLIRRAYFALIGMPPTPPQIQEFIADRHPAAFERLVDRLLASRHFGERWGRHWLDVVRFAESTGGGRTQVLPYSWRYRDYVIKSFNEDKPFDEFAREQIAGDLMPAQDATQRHDRITATGFLVLGPTNYELQDKELLRMEVVDEQVDTIGRAFLGQTIGCARCHDHKFDPIPNTDYYAMAGIFRSTKTLTPGNVSGYVKTKLFRDEAHEKAFTAYEARKQSLEKRLASLNKELGKGAGGKSLEVVAVDSLPGYVLDDSDAQLRGTWTDSTSIKPYVGKGYKHTSAEGAAATYTFNQVKAGRYEVRVSYCAHGNRAQHVVVEVRHAGGTSTKTLNHKKRAPIDGLFESLGTFDFDAAPVVKVLAKKPNGAVILDAVQLIPPVPRAAVAQKLTKKPKAGKPHAQLRTDIKQIHAELNALKKSAPAEPSVAMSVRDETDTGDYFVCIRGNVHNLGKKVPRGYLSVMKETPDHIPAGASGRLELANWLTSERNPLFARVIVNRVWHHLFGRGLVATPDNFGATGEAPTHPELLDHLAGTFIDDGYSVKELIRLIVLSKTWRQSSLVGEQEKRADPENRLLSHFSRRRLDAEAIRDAILTVGGQLDLTPGGPTISVNLRSEFGHKFTTLRRSVYVPAFRNRMHDLFEVFDVADPNLVMGRRNVSTLPTQSLYLLNSPFVIEQATAAAERFIKAHPATKNRITAAYETTLGRPPHTSERQLTRRFLNTEKASERQAWTAVFQSLFGCLDFRFVD